ncbi:hypothetical protein [Streptomyces sp. NPDC048527]|uniref:hypothetical protein n=1 Tax=Streptomyces sp. NPDC048527 TaxID=3365568 RepID=UPI003711AEF1
MPETKKKAGGGLGLVILLVALYAWGNSNSTSPGDNVIPFPGSRGGGGGKQKDEDHGCKIVFSYNKPMITPDPSIHNGARVECASKPETMNLTIGLYHKGRQVVSDRAALPDSMGEATVVATRCYAGSWQTRAGANGTVNGKPVILNRTDTLRVVPSTQCPEK